MQRPEALSPRSPKTHSPGFGQGYLETKYRIHVRPRVVPGEFSCIRVTPNVFTTLEEIDLFSGAIEEIAKKGLA